MSDETTNDNAPAPVPTKPVITLPPVDATNVAAYVGKYILLRNKIKEFDDEHKKKMEPFKDMLVALNGLFINHLNATGTDNASVKGVGTIYKTTKKSATISDAAEFKRHIIGTQDFDMLDWRANGPAVEKFLEENSTLPPGITYNVVVTAGVRKA